MTYYLFHKLILVIVMRKLSQVNDLLTPVWVPGGVTQTQFGTKE